MKTHKGLIKVSPCIQILVISNDFGRRQEGPEQGAKRATCDSGTTGWRPPASGHMQIRQSADGALNPPAGFDAFLMMNGRISNPDSFASL